MPRPSSALFAKLRLAALPLAASLLVGCALPALPKLPSLPKLPALPKLPSLPKLPGTGGSGDSTSTTPQSKPNSSTFKPTASTGQSMREAYQLAQAQADIWSLGSEPMKVQGTKLDFGGREGGHPDGLWTFTFRSEEKGDSWLRVRVSEGAASPTEGAAADDVTSSLGRNLDGVIDSPDIFNRAGLKGATFTLVLRRQGEVWVYNLVEEGGIQRMVIDARSGAQLEDNGYAVQQ